MNASTITFDQATGRKYLQQMMLVRRFEEACAEQYTKGHIRGALQALGPEDNILSTYREHGHALVRGVSPDAIMAEMFGKQEGCSKGRGGSMHLFDKATRFFGGNAIVAGHLPMSVGLALAAKRLKEDRITCCIFGEGAAAEGAFHEAMNLASLWELPLLFLCENNRYAMGTALHYSHAVEELANKGPAYGIESASIDGMDLPTVIAAANTAVQYIRDTGRPYFLVCNTYRFRAHSMFDAELYRDKAEVEEWKKRDPIPAFRQLLLEQGLITDADVKTLQQDVEDTVKQAVSFAERGTWEPLEELTRFMTTEP